MGKVTQLQKFANLQKVLKQEHWKVHQKNQLGLLEQQRKSYMEQNFEVKKTFQRFPFMVLQTVRRCMTVYIVQNKFKKLQLEQ